MLVGISIAHHSSSQGASYKGYTEYHESTVWSGLLAKELNARGIAFRMIPKGTLRKKVSAINTMQCDLAIEIHFNACGGCGANGSETLHYPNSINGIKLSTCIQSLLPTAMCNRDRGVKEGWYKMDRPGIIDYSGDVDGDETLDYFLRKTNCTAVIVEPEFIEQYSNIDLKRTAGVKAIADGIALYMQ